ncbi:uncharacterized protein VTP21DRAFT_5747 [Calcarisporiella thermophila]|uniref:uncharacterized protein n=1 Tax=Calcarisporiella thermophila TaxID=911321 RepID=UPI0037449148
MSAAVVLISMLILRVPAVLNILPLALTTTLQHVNPYFATIAFILFKHRKRAFGVRSISSLPGPKEYPLLGSALTFKQYTNRILDLFLQWRAQYGKWHTATLPFAPRIIFTHDPASIEYIQRTHFDNFYKGPHTQNIAREVLGDGIFNTNGEKWRLQRKTASNIFNVKRFRELIEGVFREEAIRVASIIERAADSGEDVDLQNLFFRFTLDTFGRISFGKHFNCLEDASAPVPFAAAFDYVQTVIDKRFRNPFFWVTEFLTGEGHKFRSAIKILDEYAYNALEKRRQERAEGFDSNQKDLMDFFLDYRHEDGSQLTDVELRDAILNFMIAGRDTTAQQLSWQYLMLMQRSEIQARIRDELSHFGDITYENIKALHYCMAVFYETLRLYPPVPKSTKTVACDDVLPSGVIVRKGDWVHYSSYVIGRDKEVWGEDAEEFNPERWLQKDEKGEIVGFNVFNGGPRICLGQTFATLESLTMTSVLIPRFRFELSPKFIEQEKLATEPLYATSVTLPMRRPLWVRVHRI